ncbi:DUF4917 family protein [Burkholderia multivorans]|uniref:DUF4917 family protein n=1 Tax=Burkholderia TaxID=32008 RepID=UPI0003EC8D41|nr:MULTISPECIES: DUF4917 family protein [Burkholderia]AHI79407.1 hypothetical protein BTJ_2629 [Burkholderia thailandensis E444]AIC87292.1 hypothetical protein BTRA_750 [Burkholderia thailandensis USAMRU Malaysia \
MPFEILPWATLADEHRGTILLGNGASISVEPRFAYRSLLDHAREHGLLTPDVNRLFAFFGTSDFELILRIVWQASNVNQSLQIADDRTRVAYRHVRDCLIQTVREIHPEHDVVSEHLPRIYEFLKSFDTIVSLNYDLLLYWSVTYGLDIDDGHAFKDCFIGGRFDDDWQRFRQPIGRERSTTLVFYPHGSLILCRDRIEQEAKIHNRDAGLLRAILDRWESEQVVPLFVSEGTAEQKVASIQSSYYLSTVYREVLPSARESLVIYGWGFGEHDLHLLRRMRRSGIRRVAVSVLNNDQAYCTRTAQILWDELGPATQVQFFDCQSPGCWNHAALEA